MNVSTRIAMSDRILDSRIIRSFSVLQYL